VDFAALIAQKDEVVHGYRKKKYEGVVGGRIRIEKGHVRFVDPHTVEVGPGTVVYIEPGTWHRLTSAEGVRTVVFGFPALRPGDEYFV
jgi:mercuric reductase